MFSFLRLVWEGIIRALLPLVSLLHISWMFRVNGASSVVPWADWLYDFTFDACTRVWSSDPHVLKPTESFFWRLFFDNTLSFPVRAPGSLHFSISSSSVGSFSLRPVSGFVQRASKMKEINDWENPEVVGRRKR